MPGRRGWAFGRISDHPTGDCRARRFGPVAGTVILLAMLLVGQDAVRAGDPPSILSVFRRRSELSAEQLQLRPEHGPWLILAITLGGDDAKDRAVRLANELRQSLRLPAFIMEVERDESPVIGETTRLVKELDGTTTRFRAWQAFANPNTGPAFAVLVGEFSTSDDPKIKATLDKVRHARPRSLQVGEMAEVEEEDTNWLVQKYRQIVWKRHASDERKQRGPMGNAFLTRNPLLPDEFFQAPVIDEFVESLNEQVEYSLLECPGRFTVRVASFQGFAKTTFFGQPAQGTNEPVSNALDIAAERANKLTLALRKKGVEAYQFHDRYGSYVTIGSFDRLGRPMPNGQFEYDPAIIAIMKKYCGYETVIAKDRVTGAVRQVTSLKSLDGVPFDPQGKPMAVPRRATNQLYRGSLLGR